jgi:hypothetical protein
MYLLMMEIIADEVFADENEKEAQYWSMME